MQRAHEVLYYVGLGEARYRNVETYSTGMKQRIKLAQALVHDPDLLFLDEPTNGMDPKGRDEMLELIRDLGAQQGRQPDPLVAPAARRRVHLRSRRRAWTRAQVAAQGPIDGAQGARRAACSSCASRATCAAFLDVLAAAGHGVPRDRRGRDARVRAGAAAGDDQRASSRPPRRTACRCGTCGRACRRSRTCSPKRWARNSAPCLFTIRATGTTTARRRRRAGRGW